MGGGDTIAAIATAPGRGGVAVVRVSGDGAMAIGERLSGSALRPGRIHFRTVSSPAGRGGATSVLDRCVVLAFAAPRSYTGEDVVEFQCHGGSVTPRRILDACFAAGARLARRGEFTERAFLNGRLDLSAAEAVIELVDARTDRAADDALARLGGAPARAYRALYDAALAVSAELEHALDVDEGELPPDFAPAVRARLAALDRDLASALARAAGGRLLREGALVVLAGPPNAGKSSLMNALLGERRAIVSATPGTTRDSIEEGLDLGGWPVRLTDTAGLRGTDDAIEAEGVERTRELLARADVVVALSEATEGSVPIPVEGSVPIEGSVPGGGAEVIRVRSKCDLADDAKDAGDGWLRVSAVTGEGLDALRAALVAALERRAGTASDGAATPSERERSLLAAARLRLAEGSGTDDPVLLANSARACAETLGALAGTVYSDDLLEALFSRFCVGK